MHTNNTRRSLHSAMMHAFGAFTTSLSTTVRDSPHLLPHGIEKCTYGNFILAARHSVVSWCPLTLMPCPALLLFTENIQIECLRVVVLTLSHDDGRDACAFFSRSTILVSCVHYYFLD